MSFYAGQKQLGMISFVRQILTGPPSNRRKLNAFCCFATLLYCLCPIFGLVAAFMLMGGL
jgi:hypothetical protein